MKKTFILSCYIILCSSFCNHRIYAQENPKSITVKSIKKDSIDLIVREEKKKVKQIEGQVFFVVEEMPQFPGGDEALKKFISDNIVYPQEAKDKGISGRVFVRFIINKYGKVERVTIARGVHYLLDSIALDVINKLPDWKPGKQRGKAVNVWHTAPINFEIDKKPEKLPAKSDMEQFDSLFNILFKMQMR